MMVQGNNTKPIKLYQLEVVGLISETFMIYEMGGTSQGDMGENFR